MYNNSKVHKKLATFGIAADQEVSYPPGSTLESPNNGYVWNRHLVLLERLSSPWRLKMY